MLGRLVVVIIAVVLVSACDGATESDVDAAVVMPDATPIGSEGGECYPAYFNDAGTEIEMRCNGGLNCEDDLCVPCGSPGEPCCRVGTGLFCETTACSNLTGQCEP
jgi:hypothetical protein